MHKSLVHRLSAWAESRPNTPAIHGQVDGAWVCRTWSEYLSDARTFGKALIALGHQPGECVAIVGDNRIEWVTCELGIMAAQGIPAPIYATNTVEQTAYIVNHCRGSIAICDKQEQLDKYLAGLDQGLFDVDHIIVWDDVTTDHPKVKRLSEVMALGDAEADDALDARIDAIEPTDTGLLIYTSGTTGVPKAVELEHGGMIEVADALLDRIPEISRDGHVPYRAVSYLPLCHAAEQVITTFGHMATGGEIYFCPDLKAILDYLKHVRPTVFLGVPRVWEKFEAALSARLADATGVKAKLVAWARDTELSAVRQQAETGRPAGGLARTAANKLVLSKVREGLGLDQLFLPVTGSAPISVGTLEFFASLGIVITEAYGMSETTAVCTLGHPSRPRFGRVGQPVRGVEIRIADDGEVLLKGRIMTRGYLHMPDETAALYESGDDWLHTGDIGELDDDGYLKITGRKKDLIITAGGKNVAPVEIEALLQQVPGIMQAVVVGDRQPYLCALVTLDVEALPELVKTLGLPSTDLAELADDDTLRAYLQSHIEERVNAGLARYQTVKKFRILPNEFSVEGGELTPTMKIRRNVIAKTYAAQIDAFYDTTIAAR